MKKPDLNIQQIFGLSTPNIFSNQKTLFPHEEQVLGMEIEVENCKYTIGDYSVMIPHDQWGITEDHSLRGRACEFVSFPMPAKSLISSMESLYKITNITEANFNDRCSIHIHANVLDFTLDQLSSLSLYYQTIEKVLFEFVGNHRDTNLYCIPWTQCLMNHSLIASLYSDQTYTLKNWQKYTALNLLPILRQGTVEFRHMHGTADLKKINIWINIISFLMWKAKTSTLESVLTEVTSLNDSSQYSTYFDSIINGQLPYNEKYQSALIDGVIHAKYSLVGFDLANRTGNIQVKKAVRPLSSAAEQFFQAYATAGTRRNTAADEVISELRAGAVIMDDLPPIDITTTIADIDRQNQAIRSTTTQTRIRAARPPIRTARPPQEVAAVPRDDPIGTMTNEQRGMATFIQNAGLSIIEDDIERNT